MKLSIKTIAILAIPIGLSFASCSSPDARQDNRDGRQDNRNSNQDGRQDNRDTRQENRWN